MIFHVLVAAVEQETWTREAELAVESPEGAMHRPEFFAMTWYTPVPTEFNVNCSLLL